MNEDTLDRLVWDLSANAPCPEIEWEVVGEVAPRREALSNALKEGIGILSAGGLEADSIRTPPGPYVAVQSLLALYRDLYDPDLLKWQGTVEADRSLPWKSREAHGKEIFEDALYVCSTGSGRAVKICLVDDWEIELELCFEFYGHGDPRTWKPGDKPKDVGQP